MFIKFEKPAQQTSELTFKIATSAEEFLKRYDRMLYLVIGVFVVSLVTMIIMTGTLIIDSFHVNSATYKEYTKVCAEKDTSVNTIISDIDKIKKRLGIK